MICYKDMTYCSAKDCTTTCCIRNQKNIDKEHLAKVDLPLAISDMYINCHQYVKEGKE